MTSWLDLLVDARAMTAIYGDTPPELSGIVVHEVTLNRDGPRMTIRFDLPTFPAEPPRKWVAGRFDVAQVSLSFLDADRVSIEGMARAGTADLSLARDGEHIDGTLAAGTMTLHVRARWVSLDSISAYQGGADDGA